MLRFLHFHLFDITEEEISGEALLAIEKNDIKEIGVKPMGRRIQLMAKIKEIINTQEKEGVISTERKRKITTQDKKKWDAKSKTMYLEK